MAHANDTVVTETTEDWHAACKPIAHEPSPDGIDDKERPVAIQHPSFGQIYNPILNDRSGAPLRRLPELLTERLVLRRWQQMDLEPFGAMRADVLGMEFFPSVVNPIISLASIEQFERSFDERGYSFWVVESLTTGAFIGTVGLYARDVQGLPAQVAIGWQLARKHWGHGYAKEAAQAVLKDGFRRLKLNEIIAVVVENNHRSRGLAETLGMIANPAPFIEPAIGSQDGALQRQILYRIRPSTWRKNSR
jgi:RimJ/RimL family protein N-acetyltransferase